jgi:peptide deformylase
VRLPFLSDFLLRLLAIPFRLFAFWRRPDAFVSTKALYAMCISLPQSVIGLLCMSLLSRSFAFHVSPAARLMTKRCAFGVTTLRQDQESLSWKTSLTQLMSSLEKEVDPGVVEGTDLRVLKYPHPSLRAQNAEITPEELKDGSVARIAKEMLLVMYAAEGVGLAAPQVGVNKKLMVYNESGDKQKWLDEMVMVNPRIVDFSEAKDVEQEGCLSFPDMDGDVERSKWIKVEALNLKGKKIKRKFTGWEARIFQHEYDHLDGTVYIDRLTEEGREKVQPRLDELIAEFGQGGAL